MVWRQEYIAVDRDLPHPTCNRPGFHLDVSPLRATTMDCRCDGRGSLYLLHALPRAARKLHLGISNDVCVHWICGGRGFCRRGLPCRQDCDGQRTLDFRAVVAFAVRGVLGRMRYCERPVCVADSRFAWLFSPLSEKKPALDRPGGIHRGRFLSVRISKSPSACQLVDFDSASTCAG